MAYKLEVKLPSGVYKSLDISKSNKFNASDAYEEYNNDRCYKIDENTLEMKINHSKIKYSLRMLDRFTMQFEDESSLKLHLVSTGILDNELINYPLVIRYVSKKKERKNYKVFFLDDYYYFEIDKLIGLIENRYLSGDFRFLRAFASQFREYNECKTTAGELYAISEEAIQYGRLNKEFNEIDSNGDNIVRRLAKLLIYKYDTKFGGDPQYKDNEKDGLNWRTLHLLIEFIKDYEQREMILLAANGKVSIHNNKKIVKEKKKEPKSDNFALDGQLTFKDLNN